jgi:hypothetical protein
MSKKSLDEEREFCRGVYEKWDFIRRIVELYAEGVSWQGCDKLDTESIKDGMRDILVSGVGRFTLKTQESVEVPMPKRTPLDWDEPAHPFLWPMTQNAEHLDMMQGLLASNANAREMFLSIVKDICLGLGVPYELLGPTAATANGDVIMWGLITFVGNISTWREYLGYRLDLTWNETWHTSRLTSYGQVYQVFKAQGIELKTLREESLHALQAMRDIGLMSRQTYEEQVRWF